MVSHHAESDRALTADPGASAWKGIAGVFAEGGYNGEPVPGHRTEIRSRWTDGNIYFLFVCPYEELYLKPQPVVSSETNKLWQWDVAEVFIGADLQNINVYKEFEVSPQGEWIDLEIDRGRTPALVNWQWNSGFEAKTRIDRESRTWFVEMRIPFSKIASRSPQKGQQFRLNLYRIQGPPEQRKHIAWQPPGKPSFHVPESFGRLVLE